MQTNFSHQHVFLQLLSNSISLSLHVSLYFHISLSLSLSKFLSVSVLTVFTLTPPFASYVQFPSNSCQGNMELWKHVVLGYGFCERKKHVCLSHPLKDCLIMSCSWLEYSMALGLRNLWHKNVQLFFPKIGSLLFVCNKRRSGKLGALHHWRAYLVHNVVAACQLMKWRNNCTKHQSCSNCKSKHAAIFGYDLTPQF